MTAGPVDPGVQSRVPAETPMRRRPAPITVGFPGLPCRIPWVSGTMGGNGDKGSDGPLRVVVIDDHEVLRAGTRPVLETTADIVVVGEAESWDAALILIDQQRPDVALVDIQLSGRNGIDLARQLSVDHPGTRVVILSAYDDDAFIRRAFEAGVAGYLLKTMPRDELINAIRAVGMGTTVLDSRLRLGPTGYRCRSP